VQTLQSLMNDKKWVEADKLADEIVSLLPRQEKP